MKNILYFVLFLVPIISHACVDEDGVCLLSDTLVCGPSTEIVKAGTVGESITVYNYYHVFGESKRAVQRVLFIGANREYLGMYSVSEFPSGVEGECIIFPFEKTEGNSLCLKDGKLPKSAWLDGENPELFK